MHRKVLAALRIGKVRSRGAELKPLFGTLLAQSALVGKITTTGDLRCLREDSPAVPIVDTAMREIVFQHATI